MTDVSLAATGVEDADHGEAPASPCEPDLRPKRRRWPDSEKARIASESFVPGASVNAVAMRQRRGRSTLSECRALAREGKPGPVPEVAATVTGTPPGRRGRAQGPAH